MKPMTTETRLVIDLGALHVRSHGPAIAGVWLESGGSEFPMARWTDFVVVVLRWWVVAVLRLLRNNTGTERVPFMEGPYAVEASRTQSGKLQFRMFAGPSGGREVAVGEADIRRFVSELAIQSERLLDECRLREWWSLDAAVLKSHLEELDREIRRFSIISP